MIEAMSSELRSVGARAAVHAALGDPTRLRIVDLLVLGDASPSEIAAEVGVASNLLAHHLGILERQGVVVRTRSEGDRRRSYVRLVPATLGALAPSGVRVARRLLFVCTANSARSHLAAALWRRLSNVPALSAGTHPGLAVAPGAVEVAARHRLDLPLVAPRWIVDVHSPDDFIVTVCDRAHEELHLPVQAHWSVTDPLRTATPAAFEAAFADLARRVEQLAPHVALAA